VQDEFDKVLSEHEKIRPIIGRLGKPTKEASLDLAAGEALLCLERCKRVNSTTSIDNKLQFSFPKLYDS
jgi:hypothetical protein